jgi:hypothetical protein
VKLAVAHPDRVIVELDVNEVMNIEAALLTFHRDQQNMQTPFGVRIETLGREFRQAQDEMWKQDARARGLTVEGDEPCEKGAF